MQTQNVSARGCGCLLAVVGWLLGGSLLLIGIAWGYRSFTVERHWVATRGVVVGLEASNNSDTFAPVVAFETTEGVPREFTHTVASNLWDLGATVDVRYDPDDPDEAVLYSPAGFWIGPVVFATTGLVVLIGALTAGAFVRRRAQRGAPGSPLRIASGPRRPAEFRRVETDLDGSGTFRWSIVAKGEDGIEYRGDWLDDDPQLDLMNTGYRVELVQRGGEWIVIQI